jgi:D-glycero-D-manno-heptose 1,7-bisphosphate phosphatase
MLNVGKPAAFLDRDGVINVDAGYVHRVPDFRFILGALSACRDLYSAGYELFVVTNQAGIARGYYDEKAFHDLTEWMRSQFAEAGAPLAGVYYCPHHPEGRVARFTRDCNCRKPAPGLIAQAAAEHQIDLSRSFLVGDKASDLVAAERAGVPESYLVRPGVGGVDREGSSDCFDSLAAVVRHVLERQVR